LKYLPVIYLTLHDSDVMFTLCIKKSKQLIYREYLFLFTDM